MKLLLIRYGQPKAGRSNFYNLPKDISPIPQRLLPNQRKGLESCSLCWESDECPLTSPRDRIKTPSVGLQPNTKKPPNFPSEARTNLPNGRRQRKGSWEVRPELRSEGFLHCWFSFYSLVFFFLSSLSFRFGENGKAWEKKGKKKKTKNENQQEEIPLTTSR